jgi:ferredoxin-type protein NapG
MERRDVFRWGLGKVAELAVKEAEVRAVKGSHRWIRPPFAVGELDFLVKCTRCDACIEACPHDVLFPLSAKFGLQVAATPAMDLVNKGCHMCADWPCVNACEPNVLVFPDSGDTAGEETSIDSEPVQQSPVFAVAAIDPRACLPYLGPECGACSGSCPVPGALVWDREKPRIDPNLCTGCALCREACIATPKAVSIRSLAAAGRDTAPGTQPTACDKDRSS